MMLLWLDVETTGLVPELGNLLEVAWALADFARPFEPFTRGSRALYFERECSDEQIDPFVIDMHTKNGLWAECAAADGNAIHLVDVDLRNILPDNCSPDEMTVLAGSSVHFDHGWLEDKLPFVSGRLSHRHYDVSAVKLFCRSLGMPKLPRAEAHRAAADIDESIAHAKACAGWLAAQERFEVLLHRRGALLRQLRGGSSSLLQVVVDVPERSQRTGARLPRREDDRSHPNARTSQRRREQHRARPNSNSANRKALTEPQRYALVQAVVAHDENGLCFAAAPSTVRILRALGFATDVDQRAYGFRITDAGREEVVCGFRHDHDPETLAPRGERCTAIAVEEIAWRDGRTSLACGAHGYNALTVEARGLVRRTRRLHVRSK